VQFEEGKRCDAEKGNTKYYPVKYPVYFFAKFISAAAQFPPYTAAQTPIKPHFCVLGLSQRSQSLNLILNTSSHQSNNCAADIFCQTLPLQ